MRATGVCAWTRERPALKPKKWQQTDECDITGGWLQACSQVRRDYTLRCVGGHLEAMAVPGGCHAIGPVLEELQCCVRGVALRSDHLLQYTNIPVSF